MIGHQKDIEPLVSFRAQLQDMLAHLYDPTYEVPDMVWSVTRVTPQQGIDAVQSSLVQAIEFLRPAPDVPQTARARRIYDLLSFRYIQQLTQEETAIRLGITSRHVRREQREAVDVLARRLWEQAFTGATLSTDTAPMGIAHADHTQPSEPSQPDSRSPQWRLQVRKELASLQKTAPGTIASVEEAIAGIVPLESTLTSQHGIRLGVEHVPPDLYVAVHPSALRQILVAAVGRLVQHMSSGQITLSAERRKPSIAIAIKGHPAKAHTLDSDLIQEIVASHGGSVEVIQERDSIVLQVALPPGDEVTVLVIDDNSELVHFYRRYTAGTKYHIVHVSEGQRVFQAIQASSPDVIVLDVMLPDMDGWELLAQLCKSPEKKAVPVIVCSVVREDELALLLGATLYLPKPVRRRPFLQALGRALDLATADALRDRGHNPAPH